MPEIALKKRSISGVNPGREYAEPRTFVPGSEYGAAVQGSEVSALKTGCAFVECHERTCAESATK